MSFFFKFIYFFLLLLFFSLLLFFYNMILTLTTLRFLSRDSLRTLRYTTNSILKIQLTFMLLTLFYLHYVQCDNAHIFRGTSFTHQHKKRETYSQKKLKVTKVKKAKLWVGLIRVRVWEKKTKSTTFSKNWFSDQHKESKIKPASRLTFGARPETI